MCDMQSPTPLRTSAEVADELGVDRATVTRWVQSGRLVPAMKLPGLRGPFMFTDEAIEQARVGTRDSADPAGVQTSTTN